MRIVFMGTPEFAVPTLLALREAGHDIAAVYTQPPRRAGRGKQPQPSPVQRAAESLLIPVMTPTSLRDLEAQAEFHALEADVGIVAAYGLILPAPVLDAPRHGCLNVHGSLLPRWRGAAPVQRAILAGDSMTGITIMQMEPTLDTGAMLARARVPVEDKTSGELHAELAQIGARLMVETLADLANLRPEPQEDREATYAAKVDKSEARIDWSKPAELLERETRAFAPAPGSWFEVDGERIKLLKARAVGVNGFAGTVLDDDLTIACGDAAIRALVVQRAGRPPMPVAEFLRGRPVKVGTVQVTRFALTLEYDGGPFFGLQRQDHGPSVQGSVERAALAVTGEAVTLHSAGRTDSGVHALAMVSHMDIAKPFEPRRLMDALNALLRPDPVAVIACEVRPDDWHARFSCTGRNYRYVICNRRAPLALARGHAWHITRPLDAEAMDRAAQALVGLHDFTTFRSVHCQSASPLKTLDRLEVRRAGDTVTVEAEARSFLHHQVRSMVGTLALVGQGQWREEQVAEALEARDRGALGLNAPSCGLYFVSARYPKLPAS